MADPDMRLADFRVQCQIASSSGGSVSRALWKRKNLSVALKRRYFPELGQQKDFLHELRLLQRVQHPHVIQCHGGFFSDDSVNFYLVLEFAEHGDLYQRLQRTKRSRQRLSEAKVWKIFTQVLSGVECIHKHSIIHRDLKSLNIFEAEGEVFKVGDLGVSRELSQETQFLQTVYGTPLYLSPEQVAHNKYDYKTDMWSLGVLLYECCELVPPFVGENMLQLAKCIENAQYEPLADCWSQAMVDVVGWMLQKDPKQRPAAAQLVAHLDDLFKPKSSVLAKPVQAQPLSEVDMGLARTREERWEQSKQRLQERAAAAPQAPPQQGLPAAVPVVKEATGPMQSAQGTGAQLGQQPSRPVSARDARLQVRARQQRQQQSVGARVVAQQQPTRGVVAVQPAQGVQQQQQQQQPTRGVVAVQPVMQQQQQQQPAQGVVTQAVQQHQQQQPAPDFVAQQQPAQVVSQEESAQLRAPPVPPVWVAPARTADSRLSARVPAKQAPWDNLTVSTVSRPMSARDERLQLRTAERERRLESAGGSRSVTVVPMPSDSVALPRSPVAPVSPIPARATQKRPEVPPMNGRLGVENEIQKIQMRRPESSYSNSSRCATPNILTWQ
eukprot:TRINITY_DN5069_c0_g1_i1.p1 TRINITY_DN5069_c0_g1~~TRINITY_DN5069_c0_g1_i1.p1  ORF type:complete len:610 (-),score=134.98 TRINITY_DN5069_c0_g1_i1:18-1847(-)